MDEANEMADYDNRQPSIEYSGDVKSNRINKEMTNVSQFYI